jgi:hypothetical protein
MAAQHPASMLVSYVARGRRPQSSQMIAYRLTPAAVTAIWRRTSLCVHELTGPSNLWIGVASGTRRTAPPTAGQEDACSSQTRFVAWLVTAIQPHASHTTSIKRAPIEGMRGSRARSSQGTRLRRADTPPRAVSRDRSLDMTRLDTSFDGGSF